MCYKTGQLDIINSNTDIVEYYEDKDELKTIDFTNVNFLKFGHLDKSPMNKNHIRRAIALSIDKETIVNDYFRIGKKVARSFNPEGYFHEADGSDFSGDKDRYNDYIGYDTETAKKEWEQGLSETGCSKIEIQLALMNSDMNVCEIIKQQCEKNLKGLNIKLIPLQTKDWIAEIFAANYDMCIAGWSADYYDPTAFFNLCLSDPEIPGRYSNPEVDRLIAESGSAALSCDTVARNKILHRIEDILMEDAAVIPLYSNQRIFLVKKEYSGFDLNPAGTRIY